MRNTEVIKLPCPKCGKNRKLKGLWIMGETRPMILCRPCAQAIKFAIKRIVEGKPSPESDQEVERGEEENAV